MADQGKPARRASDRAPGGDRRAVVDRRCGGDRRRPGIERRSGLDRRRGPGRRRSDQRRSAEEGEMTDEQFEFIMAMDEYKRVNNRPFPTWTEVLEVIKHLGYRKVAAVGKHIDSPQETPAGVSPPIPHASESEVASKGHAPS